MQPADIVGTWSLVQAIERLPDGAERPGESDEGFLAYSPDGTMFAIMDSHDRGPLPEAMVDGDAPSAHPLAAIHNLPPEEKLRAVEGFTAYAGTFVLDGKIVTHRVQFALNPALKGGAIKRTLRLENGRLVISTRNLGNPRNLDLTFERVRPATAVPT
jgi:hypothetical protein